VIGRAVPCHRSDTAGADPQTPNPQTPNPKPQTPALITCSKTYPDVPFAHRQHRHDGHCAFIHGHNWTVTLTFACDRLNEHGFVVDFGRLKYIKAWLDEHLDHACVFAADDPARAALVAGSPGLFKPYVVPCSSCEGLAEHLWRQLCPLVLEAEAGRAWIAAVELAEDARNRTHYAPPADALEQLRER